MTQRRGAEVVVVPNDEHGQLDTTELANMIDEHTRLIGVSHYNTEAELDRAIAAFAGLPRG
jgi:selenocysteine lyase/cysteine desulfurase